MNMIGTLSLGLGFLQQLREVHLDLQQYKEWSSKLTACISSISVKIVQDAVS